MAESATSPSTRKRSPQGPRSAGTSKAARNTSSRPSGASRSSANRSKSTSSSRTGRSSASRPPSNRTARAKRSGAAAPTSSRPGTSKKAAGASRNVRGPLLAAGVAAAAAVGGGVLKRQRSSKSRKVLGVSAPKLNLDGVVSPRGLDLKPIGKQVARAGEFIVTASRRVSQLSGDAERVGRSAKKLGDSISETRAPDEATVAAPRLSVSGVDDLKPRRRAFA